MKMKVLLHLLVRQLLIQVRSNFHCRNVHNQLDLLRDKWKKKLLEDSMKHQGLEQDDQQ
jgi:hypothetical protein